MGRCRGEEAPVSSIHETGEVVDAKRLGIQGFDPQKYGVEGEVVWEGWNRMC